MKIAALLPKASAFALATALGLAPTLSSAQLKTAVPANAASAPAARPSAPRTTDYIVAVVNQELVTAFEFNQRLARVKEEAGRAGQRLPSDADLRRQVLDALIEERAILSSARETVRIDDPEVDRAVGSVAAQNQLTLPQLRDRLRAEGLDYGRFRANVRDQLMIERLREREVQSRIRITDGEIDGLIDRQRGEAATQPELNVAQILVTVPEGATAAVTAERRARAEQALARVRGGEPFPVVARELSEDANRDKGGEIGLRPAGRLPDVFVEKVRDLKAGEIAPTLLQSAAGFHVLKLVDRQDNAGFKVTQTHARHILLRPSPQVAPEVAAQRLAEFKRQIESGGKRFEDLARQFSEDGSAAQGGDLGWASPGNFVPEFEQAMNQLAVGGISPPVVSRFGVHLIQVVERRDVAVDLKQLREQARNALREQKFEPAYLDWVRELKARAYIEMREPPEA